MAYIVLKFCFQTVSIEKRVLKNKVVDTFDASRLILNHIRLQRIAVERQRRKCLPKNWEGGNENVSWEKVIPRNTVTHTCTLTAKTEQRYNSNPV